MQNRGEFRLFRYCEFRYVVDYGDSLWRLAYRFYGDGARWKDIYELNKDAVGWNPNKILLGTVLTIQLDD